MAIPLEKQISESLVAMSGGIPYLLFYRQGNNPNPQFFCFYHHSDNIRIVVDRIKKHCELMNLRFVNVRRFVIDLDEVETKAFPDAAASEG